MVGKFGMVERNFLVIFLAFMFEIHKYFFQLIQLIK